MGRCGWRAAATRPSPSAWRRSRASRSPAPGTDRPLPAPRTRRAGGALAPAALPGFASPLTEHVLRDTRLRKDIVARGFELPAKVVQIDADQLSLPLTHLARDDHGLDVGTVHQRYHRSRHVVERRDVERRGVEHDDVRLFAGRERPGLAVQPQVLRAV